MEEGGPMMEAINLRRNVAKNGQHFWRGRDLMEILAYDDWRNFRNVIEKAKASCENAGHFTTDHFVEITEKVRVGSGAHAPRENYVLSKYACYLIAMNGDTGKPEVATAQAYFVEQTHKQEQQDTLTEEQRRLLLRDRVKDANRKLSGAAKEAGVRSQMFGIFHNAGYEGLYGGLGLKAIKARKHIGEKEDLLDCIGRAELAANEFRITQTEEKLRIDGVKGESQAIKTHQSVGVRVRKAIEDIGGVMPEKLKAEPSIKKLGLKKLGLAEARKAKRLTEQNES